MCIYTLKKQKLNKKIKIPQGGGPTQPNVPKLGMPCYIQLEYIVLFRW